MTDPVDRSIDSKLTVIGFTSRRTPAHSDQESLPDSERGLPGRKPWLDRPKKTRAASKGPVFTTTDCFKASCRERPNQGSEGGIVRPDRRETEISDRGKILMFDKGVGLNLRNESLRRVHNELIEAERMSVIGSMACSISHDMRHSLSAIYANAELLERHDISESERADLLLEIQEAVLAMTERLDSLLQFSSSGRKNALVRELVSSVVERAVAAVKFHPDGQNVPITVGKLPAVEAVIDARNLESAIYNLLLNACQAAIRSTHAPEVKVQLTEVNERIYVTILDNGPGIPLLIRKTLCEPFVTAGKPNGTGLGLTLARRIAEEHGGSVWLEESTQEWTVFTLSLSK